MYINYKGYQVEFTEKTETWSVQDLIAKNEDGSVKTFKTLSDAKRAIRNEVEPEDKPKLKRIKMVALDSVSDGSVISKKDFTNVIVQNVADNGRVYFKRSEKSDTEFRQVGNWRGWLFFLPSDKLNSAVKAHNEAVKIYRDAEKVAERTAKAVERLSVDEYKIRDLIGKE